MNSNDIQNKINEMIKTNIDNLLDTKEVFNRITQNTMFNPISKVVLENIPPEYDIIHTYEYLCIISHSNRNSCKIYTFCRFCCSY